MLLVAGLAAGAVNAVAGGGTLLTLPCAAGGRAQPGVGQRQQHRRGLAGLPEQRGVLPRAVEGPGTCWYGWRPLRSSVALPARRVLLSTPAKVFHEIVPYLVFAATGLLAAQPEISRRMAARRTEPVDPDHTSPLLPAAILLAAVYGAYFGGGLGIVLLAVLALGIPIDLGRLNALKTYLQLLINTVALIGFALFGPVGWAAAADRRTGQLSRRHRRGQGRSAARPPPAAGGDRALRRAASASGCWSGRRQSSTLLGRPYRHGTAQLRTLQPRRAACDRGCCRSGCSAGSCR